MPLECERLVDSYVAWLRSKITLRDIDGACEITTPFLDRHNDRIQIYVEQKNGFLLVSDDGNTLNDLELSGCKIDTPNRKQMLQTILNGFAVEEIGGELQVRAAPDTFAHKKHSLLQAILTVNDMFMMARPHVARFFREDVANFLDSLDVRYAPDVSFQGKSGYTHHFDFVIPKSRKSPERVIKAINNPNKDSATALLFSWTDTKEIRPPKAVIYAVLNDTEKSLNADVLSAFHHYEVKTVLWSKRDEYAAELAA
jgi:hypothetical protein